MDTQNAIPNPQWWVGTILKVLISLFLLFDAAMKIIKHTKAVESTVQLGLPEDSLQVLGLYLLLSTVLYIYPATALLGILFITAYLGGAVAIMYKANLGGHPYFFPIVIAVIIVLAEFLRNEKMKSVLPFIK
jgi:hypothetical protein